MDQAGIDAQTEREEKKNSVGIASTESSRVDNDLHRPAAVRREREPAHVAGHILQTGTDSHRPAHTVAHRG